MGSTGYNLRDDRGQFLAASCRGLPFISDAATAEATTLRDGLLLAGQIGCNRIEVNSDYLEVMEIMQNGGDSMGAPATIYEECTFLCRNFTEVVFYHCPRDSNVAAHSVARFGVGLMQTIWHEDPPDFLVSILANNVTIIPK
jgi:hypothetical protein